MRLRARWPALLGSFLLIADNSAHAENAWGRLYPSVFLTTDYRYEGASFTGHEPTMQASLFWARSEKFYAGLWVSGVDFSDVGDTSTSYEIDIYGGRNFPIGQSQVTLEAMYTSFPDNETPGPTYDFFTAKARFSRVFDDLTVGGGVSYVPEAPYGAGPQWRANGETSYRWNDWLSASVKIGRLWSRTQRDRSFWDIGTTFRWNHVAFDLRYSDTDQSFSECGYIDWCQSGVTLTMQFDLWQ